MRGIRARGRDGVCDARRSNHYWLFLNGRGKLMCSGIFVKRVSNLNRKSGGDGWRYREEYGRSSKESGRRENRASGNDGLRCDRPTRSVSKSESAGIMSSRIVTAERASRCCQQPHLEVCPLSMALLCIHAACSVTRHCMNVVNFHAASVSRKYLAATSFLCMMATNCVAMEPQSPSVAKDVRQFFPGFLTINGLCTSIHVVRELYLRGRSSMPRLIRRRTRSAM